MNRHPRKFLPCLIATGAMALVLYAGGAPIANVRGERQSATDRRVTFNRDLAPIVFRTCAACHRPGEAGPFPLLSYQDVKSHAKQVAVVTRKRFMPPWLPAPGELQFADDLRLTDEQIALFQKWFEDGSPEGNAADLPPRPEFAPGWQLGKPDLVLQAAKPYRLPLQKNDAYWNFIFRAPVTETRWVKAVEIRPGDKRLVHHANLLVDRGRSARRQEKSPGSGFAGMELQIESETFDPDGHFLFWKPGSAPITEPEGMALRFDPGNDLVLNTHLQPSGKPEWIQPSIGLYFTREPATRLPVLLQLENDRMLDIPPGEKNFVVTDEFTLPVDVDLLAIYPHAHYLGKDLLAQAKLPDGRRKTLLHIPNWDLNWQAVYCYAETVTLPRGTSIVMRYVYDNSSDNVLNPNDPPQRVRAGNRASDEMAHLWLQVLPHGEPGEKADPRMVLQEALARHHVEKNPADFEGHYNLGAMLQVRGDLEGAIAEYGAAALIRPGNATAENALGGALLAVGRLPEAVARFHAALKTQPDYFDAHYNLGNALAAQSDFKGAAEEFQAALRLNPQDADAEANLGGALAESGRLAEAKAHLERALRLNPQHRLARENLEEVRRRMSAQ